MVGGIRTLGELTRHGGTIQATCRQCGRVALFAVSELATHFLAKGWSDSWPAFSKKLRCSGKDGCGSSMPNVAWLVDAPPPDHDPSPPKPRMVRTPQRSPVGISQEDWEKAKTDRERRRLIRIARG
jgi:hypothetical protein